MTGYCFKCKSAKEILESQEVVMKNGNRATKGKCADCKTTMFKIHKKEICPTP
jgi:hypothetical protein